jgi:mono/diheme cytochrome c family protein
MKTKQIIRLATIMLATVLFVLANNVMAQPKPKPWDTPAKYKTMKGAGDVATGKELYGKHCKSCHGAKGLGDGPKASGLKTTCGDFSSKDFQAFTDGEIYYKTTIGRDEMPSYQKKLPDDSDRWALVSYMRTLKK